MFLKMLLLQVFLLVFLSLTDALTQLELFPGLQCSYNYDLQVHTHRGKRSTKELNFKINAKVNLDVIDLHPEDNDGQFYVTRLQLRHPRVIRTGNGKPIKHVVNHNLEEKLANSFYFLQDVKGRITQVFYPHEDSPDIIGLKKGVVSALNMRLHHDEHTTSYEVEEEDNSGIHVTYYNVSKANTTHVDLTKKWTSDDYLKHADGRPVSGKQHSKSHYHSAVKIENNAVKSVEQTHWSYLHNDRPYKRPLHHKSFRDQPDFEFKASGESQLHLLGCSKSSTARRTKRYSENRNVELLLAALRRDNLTNGDMHRLKWASVGNPKKPTRTFYELLRCYSDPSVKESELSTCIKELHYLARNDDEIFQKIVNLTLERSHQNFSTWSGLVGSLVVKGDYYTQKILTRVLLSESPRPLTEKEHSALLEAVYFIPSGPLYPDLVQALMSLHRNVSKHEEVSVRAMLVLSGLVKRSHEAGYNRSLSDNVMEHLHNSFKTHPARLYDRETVSHETYLRNHLWAFGNLGHPSSLKLITRFLDHDNSNIRYSAVSALRKLSSEHTDRHLLRVLKHDEHVAVKAGVVDVFLERRQNLSDELQQAIEDALWKSEEGDEVDSKITELLENHGDNSHDVIKRLRKRRETIRRKKRAFVSVLKPREFVFGPRKKWVKVFGGRMAGSEAMVQFSNQVKLKIGIFGGRFEVDLDNFALFRAHVIAWSFNVLDGKAAFKMSASFKNDIPKDLIHTISDTADSFLAKVDALSSIFTKHIQNFINKLKNYLPISGSQFFDFLGKAAEFITRTIQSTRFGRFFSQIVKNLKIALRTNVLWNRIANLVFKLLQNLASLKISNKPFEGAFQFLNKLVDLVLKVGSGLPRGFPVNFNIKEFLKHISAPFSSIGDAVGDYFKSLGVKTPRNLFGMLHFKITLRFPVSLNQFKTISLRLLKFGNNFLEMFSVFQDMIKIDLPLHLPKFVSSPVQQKKPFDFDLSFDWRIRFNFKINFASNNFAKFRNFFRYLAEIFQKLDGPNVDLSKFFGEFLPGSRNDLRTIDSKLFRNTTDLNIARWFRELIQEFQNLLNEQDKNVFDFSDTSKFLEELGKKIGVFSKKTLKTVCKFQGFILNSAGQLQSFGETLENETIIGIKTIEDETQTVIAEVVNVTRFVDNLIDELRKNLSNTAKEFVGKFLTRLEGSLENVKELADNIAEFTSNSSEKLTGFCHKTADFTGEILEQIQLEAENAARELTSFIASNSGGITNLVSRFKSVVTNVEKWYEKNLEKRLGKYAIVSQTLEEFLSLLKNTNSFWKNVYTVSTNINDVIQHLGNLPEHAQKAREAADKVTDFANNAERWKTEVKKLNIRRKFKLDFDNQLRKLCNDFQTLSQDTVKKIQGDELFKTFREFVTKETDSLISRAVGKLHQLKEPLERVRKELEKVSDSVSEVGNVLTELRPFSENFSPILREISQLPNCSEIEHILGNVISKCGKGAKAFGKQAYGEYVDLKLEVGAFLELIPDEWENLNARQCISGGTCLSQAFTKQAQGVSKKIKTLKNKFDSKGLFESLEPCKDSVEDVTRVVNQIKNISKLVDMFTLKDDMKKIKDLSRRITGKFSGNEDDSHVAKRSAGDLVTKVKNLAEHIKKAMETKEKLEKLVEEVFGKLEGIYRDNIEPFQENSKNVRQKLAVVFNLSKKSGVINPSLQAVDTVVRAMTDFTNVVRNVVDPLEGTVLDVLLKTSDFTDIFEDKLKTYGNTFKKVSDEVNSFLDKIVSFLNTIQLRQKGLDIRDYKSWDQYPHCSQEVCLRLLRRSSRLYLNNVFPWKYPHLDDLSLYPQTGKWLVPGLFDDYKVRSIAQLSGNEMLLGMRGVSSNTDKASLLVVVDTSSADSRISKILQIQHHGKPFQGDMGGLVIVKSLYIWMSSGKNVYAVRLSDLRNSTSTKAPSIINIEKTKSFSHEATSVSYDDRDHVIWVADANSYKAFSYQVGPFGDIWTQKRALKTGQYTRGLVIVRQSGVEYACVAKCALVAGYQCKLEFHNLTNSGVLDESSLHRVVRTPAGLESIETVDSEHVVAAFSSGTFSEKDKIERIAGDFEDRFFKFKVPTLSTGFSITENCILLRVGSDWIIPARRLFPVGKKQCGSRRKRNALEQEMDSDVYTDEPEKHKRVRRHQVATESAPCVWNFEGEPHTGSYPFVPEIGFYVVVIAIPVYFSFGADGRYYANYRISLCLRDKQVKLALIPGAWVTVYAGASLSLFLFEVGVTVEAKLLEIYLIPEMGVRIDKWPLRACLELKMQLTPLSIRVYLWYRFRLCFRISISKWFRIRISDGWCSKNTFAEWSWSSGAIHKTLFTNCEEDNDNTPPGVGECSAKQVGNKKYYVQWQGFTEDTMIQHYIVTIGSIKGSGDDHYSIHGPRQSLLVSDLEIMHGRSIYVGVYATNGEGLKSQVAECSEFMAERRSPVVTFINDGESSEDIDYQSDTTSIAMNYGLREDFSEISSIQWGVSSSEKCTLAESEADVLSLRDIGESFSIKKTGMDLTNGGRYYTRVMVINRIGLATVACSDGFVIDTTPPTPRGFTVGKEGSKFLSSLRRVSGKFQDFVDIESPMVHYEWKLVDEDTGADITNYKTIPLTQKSPLLDGLSLISGKRYTAVLKGTNAAGLYSTVSVSGIIPDDTLPFCEGTVRDVISFEHDQDKDFVRQLTNLTASFTCYDQDSGIQSTEAAVGTYPGGANVRAFVNVDKLVTKVSDDSKTTWVAFTNVTVTSLVRYYVTVKVRNNAGLVKTISSDGILVDTTEPTVLPSYIRDGYEGVDKKFSKHSDVFPAHWENAFADAESGIGEYYVGLATTPGLDDQSAFKSYGLNTQAVISGGALESGLTYYVTVIGCNRVRMCVNASSNGAMVDFVPPHTGLVVSGHQGPPIKITWINKAAWARWQWCPADKAKLQFTPDTCKPSSFYDKHSGIKHFGLSVFSHDTAELVTPVKTVGRVVVSGRHVIMPNGVFSVLVEAEDRAGVRSNSVSKSFIVDATPPQVVQVHHGNEYQPMRFTKINNHMFSAYLELTEDVTNIVSYSVGVGSYPGGDDVIPLMTYHPRYQSSLLRVNWTSSTITSLVNGKHYFIAAKGINSAGLFLVATSKPLIFDNEKPTVAYVFDGWGTQDAEFHSFPTIYRMHWRRFTDFSGIKETTVCLSSSKDENNCDIHAKVVISNKDSSHSFTKLQLKSGVRCFALLQLVDNAGNLGNYWSDGALVDTSPPKKGKVTDGQKGENLEYQRATNILYASWSGFTENETSIHHYELAFGTRKNTSDIQPFTNAGLVTSAASSNLLVSELQNGVIYYAQVIAYNPLGAASAVASSDGVLVDSTPPTFSSPVFDGAIPNTDADYSSERSSVSVNWKCEDKDSGLSQTFVGFGTQPGIHDLATYQAILPYQTSFTLKNVSLLKGFTYFATVKCVDKVGLQTSAVSNGLTFDSTPPLLHFLYDGLNIHHDASFVGITSPISANWKFIDQESHITSYYVSINHLVNGTTVFGPKHLPGIKNSITVRLQDELKHGEHYIFSITAENGAGLNVTEQTNGFVVDATPPVCSNVYDTTTDGTKANFNSQTTKLAVYFECEDFETGLAMYQFAIKDITTSRYILPFHKIKTVSVSSSRVVVDGAGKQILKLNNGGRYQVGVRATNKVNLTKEYWTQGVIIDSTPPVFRKVIPLFQVHSETIKVSWELFDDESEIKSVFWSLNTSPDIENPRNFTEISRNDRELLISGIYFKLGQTYYVYLKASNKAGLSTVFVSDGVLVDRTPPSAGRVSADFVVPSNYDGNPNVTQSALFATKWSGFTDEESGVRSYKWAVGLSKEGTKALDGNSYTSIQFTGTLNGYVIKDQTIYTDTTYYVCIRVTNGAGLTTSNCSRGVFVKLGKLTAGVVYDGPLSKDIDFQVDDRAVWLHWNGFEDPVYGLKEYEWCYGLVTNQDADQINCTSSLTAVDPPLKSSAHRFHNMSLLHGQRYGVKVQASSRSNQTVAAISDGFKVDRTAPSAGVIKVGSSHGTRTVYLTGISAPVVTWVMSEKESVMEEFQLGVGSSPQSTDLFRFIKLDGTLRSVNLDDFNFTLSDAMSFFVTVVGKNVLGLETSITSSQVIVDWTPPTPGVVYDGNGTRGIDYQVDTDHVSATWSRFLDSESDVVEYKYCVGTRPDFCDVWNATSVNLYLHVRQEVTLDHGVTYFVTVTAINGAGLSSSSSSSGVTVDISPPTIRRFSLDSVVVTQGNATDGQLLSNASLILTNPWTISASWDDVNDAESDIKRMIVCAGRTKNDCDLLPWTDIDPEASSFTIALPKPLQPGTALILSLKAKNGAGLEMTVYSDSARLDTSPPMDGRVRVGNKMRLVFLRVDQSLRSSWKGFEDPESGIKLYEWKICSTSEMSECVSSFVNAGKNKSLVVNDAGLEQGKEYHLVVKATNYAGLETEAVSNPFMLDRTPPETGMVFDGNIDSVDQVFQSSSSEISVNWKGFQDKESCISRYEVCVGSRPGLCDVRAYTSVGLTTKTTIRNMNLTPNSTYFTSVQAVNGAGQTSFTPSDGITTDLTSPVGGNLGDGEVGDIDVTRYGSYVASNWEEFHDPESSVSKYVVCAGSAKGVCDILPLTVVTSGRSVKLQVDPSVGSGTTVYSTLRVHNEAGGVTVVHSDGVLVDTTPPDVGKVEITSSSKMVGITMYLTSKTSLCASWKTFSDTETQIVHYYFALCLENDQNTCPIPFRDLNNRTSVCIDDPAVTEGEKYVIKIEATNQVGLSSTAKSTYFVIDTSEPSIGDIIVSNLLGEKYNFISTELQARWNAFVDLESGVIEYLVCVGTEPGVCDTTELTSAGNSSQYIWSIVNLTHNEEYFVSIKAVNKAGLISNFTYSDPISVDKTAADPSKLIDGFDHLNDIDHQQSKTRVAATWFTIEDPESDVIQLTWCVGTKPQSCDLKSSSPLNTTQTAVSSFLDQPIRNGDKYFVTLIATNGAGLASTMVSDGVVVDYTIPTPGLVIDGNDQDLAFIKKGEEIYAHWTGFSDFESSINFYEFALCEKGNLTTCPSPFSNTGKETNISLSGTELVNGMEYFVIIRATNMVGLSVEAKSDGFIVDETAPVAGNVWIVNSEYDLKHVEISARWENFFDPESDIFGFEICLGKSQDDCEGTDFEKVGKNTTHSFTDVVLVHKGTYYVIVKAINNVGLHMRAISKEINIDFTAPKPVRRNSVYSSDLDSSCHAVSGRACKKARVNATKAEKLVDISCIGDLVEAKWLKHEDVESGITKVEWCVESFYDMCNIRGWKIIQVNLLNTSAVIHSLQKFIAVRVVVRITNGVGRSVLLKSSLCNPQKSYPPEVEVKEVHDLNNTETDVDYQTNNDVILVAWSLPNNANDYFRVQAALTSPFLQKSIQSLHQLWRGEPFVFEFVDVPSGKTYVIFSGPRLKPYIQYHAIVRVWNEFGLYRDSVSDGVVIVPDAPPEIHVNVTDTFIGTEQKRWQKYVDIPSLPRTLVENTYYVPDAFSVVIDTSLDEKVNSNTNNSSNNSSKNNSSKNNSLHSEHIQVTSQASVYRVTQGANETGNETVVIRHIFEHSHVQGDYDVCCSRQHRQPRTVYADKHFNPVRETSSFGASVALGNGLVVASSINTVYIVSAWAINHAPIILKSFNSSSNDSFVKVKAKDNTVIISGKGNVLLYKIDRDKTMPQLSITNCNYTMKDKSKHCIGDEAWSSSESVGRAFAYDGSDVLVVSGNLPLDGNGLVAVFENQTAWVLRQVLNSVNNDSTFGKEVAVNKKFLVVLTGDYQEVVVYSKGLNNYWKKETKRSVEVSKAALGATNVHLTDGNLLFIVSTSSRVLTVFDLAASTANSTMKCSHGFSRKLKLSGSLDVVEGEQSIVAVGIMANGRDGAELILYEHGDGCSRIGRVLAKTGLRYDDGRPRASIAVARGHVVIGTPATNTWPTDYVQAGTGRVYLATFCQRNFVRRKRFEFGHQEEFMCVPCGPGEKAYPGFEERCFNCSQSVCVEGSPSALSFKVSHCDHYPCSLTHNRSIIQNTSQDNLTVTEVSPGFENDKFYLPGAEQSYFIRISQLTSSGLTTISDSFAFSIDNTSPEPGYVYDGIGSDGSKNCSANTTFGSKHQCSSRSVSNTDIDFTNNTAEISARWIDFRDNESDIEHYFWCIGSRPLGDDILKCENVTDHSNRTVTGLSLQHNDTYYVTVLACNYAGLCTARSTDGVLVDTTPPVIHYVRDGLIGPDIDFQVFTNMIFGNWAAEDPESGVASFEIGWGFAPGLDDVWEFQELGNVSAWYAKFAHGDLVKGKRYYVTVRAINGAGLESEPMSSNGIVVGKTEFLFSKNDSGLFFFDTVNVNTNESMEDSGIGNTFGTLDVPAGAVDEEVKFRCYSLDTKELKNGTDDNTTVVDPEVVKPPKHFKLGNYSFQIKAFEPTNNTLQSKYHFKKPITISMFYDVDQMLKGNKKVVSEEVTKQDIDPVLLLWDSENQTWFDAAETCPEPWTFVDRPAKLLKVHVCHLTQFALFWTFEAENGIIEFHKRTNETALPPHAAYEDDNSVVYRQERYGKEIVLDIVRRKGSTGTILVTWDIIIQSRNSRSLIVSPMSGNLTFVEGQWNSSISIQFVSIPQDSHGANMYVRFGNASGGALLGNLTSVNIVFLPVPSEVQNPKDSSFVLEILSSLAGVLAFIAIIVIVVCLVKRHRRSKTTSNSAKYEDNPGYMNKSELEGQVMAETSFTQRFIGREISPKKLPY